MKPLQRATSELRTKRLVLRRLRTSDAEPMFALFNNWQVVRWLSSPPWPYTIDHAHAFVRERMKTRQNPAETILVICVGDALIGAIDWMPPSDPAFVRTPMLGYWLGQPYWGRGYMTEAARVFIAHAFASGAGENIRSGAFADNAASLRVQEKLGFVCDGETLLASRPRGAKFPHVNTVLTRSRFESALREPEGCP